MDSWLKTPTHFYLIFSFSKPPTSTHSCCTAAPAIARHQPTSPQLTTKHYVMKEAVSPRATEEPRPTTVLRRYPTTPPPSTNPRLQAAMASKLLLHRRLFRFLQLSPPSSPPLHSPSSSIHGARFLSVKAILGLSQHNAHLPPLSTSSRSFCSRTSNLLNESQAPTTIDYRSLLQEGEFHRLADSTIHSLQEKFEDYGDSVEVDGFDIDYGNDVLTVKLGDLGTYVLNKQTPNRQLWLSSPVSGPSRFDWDQDTKAWIYRRNKANLYKILETELEQLCGKALVLS